MMKKSQRAISLAVAVLLSGSTLFGCSKSGTTSSGSQGKNIELSISHYYSESDRKQSADTDSFLTMIDQFKKKNPNITVKPTVMAASDYETKIQAQAAANQLPDLFLVKGSWMPNYVANNLIAPIDDQLNAYAHKSDFRTGIFDSSTVNGKIYGLPLQFSVTSVVYYNQKLWKDIGYDKFPDNWDDLYKANEKFKSKNITTMALGNKDQWQAESCVLSALGDHYTGTDWTNSIIKNDGKAKFTDPEFVSALTTLQNLATKGVLNKDANSIGNNNATEMYCNGKAASTVDGYWDVSYILQNGSDDVKNNTKLAVLPSSPDGKGQANTTSGGCGWYLCVNNSLTGAKKDAAMKMLFSVLGYDFSKYAVTKYGTPYPSNISDVDMSKFPALTQEYNNFLKQVKIVPIYDIAMDNSVIEKMNPGIQAMLNGSKKPADLAAEIQAEQNNVKK